MSFRSGATSGVHTNFFEESLVQCQQEEHRKPPCCPRLRTNSLSEILRRIVTDWKAHCRPTLRCLTGFSSPWYREAGRGDCSVAGNWAQK